MTTPQKTIIDCVTGETVTLDLNEIEVTEYKSYLSEIEKNSKAKAKAEKALADKQQTILDRLGLTADEFKTLIG